MNRLFRFFVLTLLFPLGLAFSQSAVSAAAAEPYLDWAAGAIGEGRWGEALGILERGADFADASSDVSYLLAEVRCHEGLPLPSALDSLHRALATGRWERYVPSLGLLLEAEILIRMRNYAGALRALDLAEQDPSIDLGTGAGAQDTATTSAYTLIRGGTQAAPRSGRQYAALLRLLALKGLADTGEFVRVLGLVMDRYPRDPRPVELLFSWAAGRMPAEGERALVDLALRRLPLLLEAPDVEEPEPPAPGSRLAGTTANPGLAYLAAPFIRDTAEARRLIAAYRAQGRAAGESLPISLDLGLIDDTQAVEELFESAAGARSGQRTLDKGTILRVWSLLRGPEGQALLRRGLLDFSGTIVTDSDGDGLREEWVRYSSGTPLEYGLDADQDGQDELRVEFSAGGIPLRAEEGGRLRIEWERYPAVLQAELDGVLYIPAPQAMLYAPLRFTSLTGDAPLSEFGAGPGPLHPELERRRPRLTERALVSFAMRLVRPSAEFPGGLEYIELDGGVPIRAEERVEGRTVSLTEFVLGRPRLQRIDLDLDGRMETLRHFREGPVPEGNPLAYEKILESVETDRDRDGLYEMAEYFFPDGTSIYRWDSDGDGIRDYTETRGASTR
ncbi:MAG: hypothetical protein LBU00_04380 [Treponema sp.]|jgi:hypothetical protein|nr:hypothetical protein [Treponema sp.]